MWYVDMAKRFQKGYLLPYDGDVYEIIDESEEARIIAHAAAVEEPNKLHLKVAKNFGADLGPLTSDELQNFKEYMHRVKDAGVRIRITSLAADELRLNLTVYYDPLVLDENGARLDGTAATPVKDAIRAHLKKQPFNGLFVINRLIDAIERVEGVRIAMINSTTIGQGPLFFPVTVERVPLAGYLILDNDYTTINYLPHGVF